jgi:predicted TIM-barrel fold metal-dependent hydrolase
VWVDLSGSGVDVDMIHAALDAVGAERLLWGTDLTMDTGWAKLRYLQSLGLPAESLAAIGYGNAAALFRMSGAS